MGSDPHPFQLIMMEILSTKFTQRKYTGTALLLRESEKEAGGKGCCIELGVLSDRQGESGRFKVINYDARPVVVRFCFCFLAVGCWLRCCKQTVTLINS